MDGVRTVYTARKNFSVGVTDCLFSSTDFLGKSITTLKDTYSKFLGNTVSRTTDEPLERARTFYNFAVMRSNSEALPRLKNYKTCGNAKKKPQKAPEVRTGLLFTESHWKQIVATQKRINSRFKEPRRTEAVDPYKKQIDEVNRELAKEKRKERIVERIRKLHGERLFLAKVKREEEIYKMNEDRKKKLKDQYYSDIKKKIDEKMNGLKRSKTVCIPKDFLLLFPAETFPYHTKIYK